MHQPLLMNLFLLPFFVVVVCHMDNNDHPVLLHTAADLLYYNKYMHTYSHTYTYIIKEKCFPKKSSDSKLKRLPRPTSPNTQRANLTPIIYVYNRMGSGSHIVVALFLSLKKVN